MAYKIMEKDTKDVLASDTLTVVKGVDVKKRTLTIIGTSESKDRQGDIIRMKGWVLDNYLKNPVFLWAHNYGSVPIGGAVQLTKRKNPLRMEFVIKFPTEGVYPFADMVLQLYQEKIINASSVGFIPMKWEKLPDDEKQDDFCYSVPREYVKQELLELSGCPVPSNPTALQNAIKGKDFGMGDANLTDMLTGKDIPIIYNKENLLGELHEIGVTKLEMEEDEKLIIQVPGKIGPGIEDPDAKLEIVEGKSDHEEEWLGTLDELIDQRDELLKTVFNYYMELEMLREKEANREALNTEFTDSRSSVDDTLEDQSEESDLYETILEDKDEKPKPKAEENPTLIAGKYEATAITALITELRNLIKIFKKSSK